MKKTTTHLTGLNQQPSQDIVTMTSHEKRLSGNVCHERVYQNKGF